MSETPKDGGPAFPSTETYDGYNRDTERHEVMSSVRHGMSLRDYFAGQALVALGDHKAVTARGIPWLVEHAYMVADAMLEQREKSR